MKLGPCCKRFMTSWSSMTSVRLVMPEEVGLMDVE